MPEEVNNEPRIASRITDAHQQIDMDPRIIMQKGEAKPAKDFHDRLQHGVNGVVTELKTRFLEVIDYDADPETYETVEHEIELVSDIVFGPLRLGKETLQKEKFSEEDKEISARMQHAITHAAYYAATPEADPNYTQSIYEMIRLGKKLSFLPQLGESQLKRCWAGIQAEIAGVKALKRGGYSVFLPDYSQNTLNLDSDEENEVLQLDVRSGIDMIAVRNGRTFLIDTKGRTNVRKALIANINKGEKSAPLIPEKISFGQIRNPAVLMTLEAIRGITKLDYREIYSLNLLIPGAAANFQSLELPENPNDPKLHLEQFGRLEDMQERSILWRMEHPEQAHNVLQMMDAVLIDSLNSKIADGFPVAV